jgi:hypothetical protein
LGETYVYLENTYKIETISGYDNHCTQTPQPINQSILILIMSAVPTRYIINLTTCFSCDKLQSPTRVCDCGFNVDTVCQKIMGLCQRKEIHTINYLAYIIETFTLKYVKKISSKFGYVSSISLGLAAKVCAIEFAMRSGWFKYGNYREMLYAARSEADRLIGHYSMQDNHAARITVWNASITDRRILTPPSIGALRQDIYRSKLMFAHHIQTELNNGSITFHDVPQIMLLPDHVTFTLRIHPTRPIGATVVEEVRQPGRVYDTEDEVTRRAVAASLETQRIEREKQIAINNVKTWKSISIITDVLEKSENGDDEYDTCPICRDEVIHTKKTKTNCGHIVCSDCVSDMITKCGSKCIMCRAVVTSLKFGSIMETMKCLETKIQILSV